MTEQAAQGAEQNPYDEIAAEQQAALDASREEAEFLKDEPSPEETAPDAEKPETQPEAKPQDDEKYANLQKALSESRYEGRQFKRELGEMRDLLKSLVPTEQTQDPSLQIDVDSDPLGALKALVQQNQQRRQQEAEAAEQRQRDEHREAVFRDLNTHMVEAESAFRELTADYDDAAKYQVQSRMAELKALGHGIDPSRSDEQNAADLMEIIKNEYVSLIYSARQSGQNPAALVYAQAKARGFTGATPEPAEATPAESGPASAALEAMKAAADTPKAPRGGAKGGQGAVTVEALEKASGKEFDRLWEQFEAQNAQ